MKTGYITNDFSTLGGLAAVAYGDPEYFREVQNQVYAQSPTKFLNTQRPSDIFESFYGTKELFMAAILRSLEAQYSSAGKFADFIDIEYGSDWKPRLISEFKSSFFEELDSVEGYGVTLSDYIGKVVTRILPTYSTPEGVETLSREISESIQREPRLGSDVSLITRAIANNPQAKVSTPPPNSRVDLDSSVDLGLDYRGVPVAEGYISPQKYWKNVAFSGLTSTEIPLGLKDSIKSGLVGYLSSSPLEALYNPSGAASILGNMEVGGSGLPITSILSQFPENLGGDKELYAISLMGEKLNGYTTFDPKTMSNGDLLDVSLAPTFEEDNTDPQGGLNSTARDFTPAF